MNTAHSWFVVYTKPNCERKVNHQLNRMGFESYYPNQLILKKSFSQEKLVSQPLFTSKIFVRCTEADLTVVKRLKGVGTILYWLNKPAVVPEEDLQTIQYVTGRYTSVQLHHTGIGSVKSKLPAQEDQRVFTLASIGYALVVEQNNEKPVAELCVSNRSRTTKRPLFLGKNVSGFLSQVPRLLTNKLSRVPLGLTRKLEQQ